MPKLRSSAPPAQSRTRSRGQRADIAQVASVLGQRRVDHSVHVKGGVVGRGDGRVARRLGGPGAQGRAVGWGVVSGAGGAPCACSRPVQRIPPSLRPLASPVVAPLCVDAACWLLHVVAAEGVMAAPPEGAYVPARAAAIERALRRCHCCVRSERRGEDACGSGQVTKSARRARSFASPRASARTPRPSPRAALHHRAHAAAAAGGAAHPPPPPAPRCAHPSTVSTSIRSTSSGCSSSAPCGVAARPSVLPARTCSASPRFPPRTAETGEQPWPPRAGASPPHRAST